MLSAYLTAPALHTEKDSNFFTLNINGKGGKMNFEKKDTIPIASGIII